MRPRKPAGHRTTSGLNEREPAEAVGCRAARGQAAVTDGGLITEKCGLIVLPARRNMPAMIKEVFEL
jgi:hypothetical protein